MNEKSDLFLAMEQAAKLIELTRGENIPEMKTPLAVKNYENMGGIIRFWANEEYARLFEYFGDVENHLLSDNRWRLRVDGRFDFDEVRDYMISIEDVFRGE